MARVTVTILLVAVAQELDANDTNNVLTSMDVDEFASNSADTLASQKHSEKFVDKLVKHLVNSLIDLALEASFLRHADLNRTTLGRLGQVKTLAGSSFVSTKVQPQLGRQMREHFVERRTLLNRLASHIRAKGPSVVGAALGTEPSRSDAHRGISKLSTQLKDARASIEEDEELSLLMQSLRGANLNNDDAAAAGLEMRLVEFELEEEHLPRRYDPEALKTYFSKRPRKVLERSLQVASAASGFLTKIALDKVQDRSSDPAIQSQRAAELRDLVTSLGPFFIKVGQALSIRPDILPPKSMVELQKLCDKVPAFDSKLAMRMLTEELGATPDEIFSEITEEPVAAASLGQVYKARLRTTGEVVAVKVQRPFVLGTVSLDLYLMRELGLLLRQVPMLAERTDVVALVDEFAGRFYDELDYRLECKNGIRIAEHMASLPKVVIPKCYPEYTSRRVHTAEWVDGEKLAQSTADDVLDLVNVGVIAYLTQLLGEGFFHADPHPGNMIRTPDGRLCILDFGLMTELTDDQKYGMVDAIVHLINRDYSEIGDDFKKLDFIPKEVDVKPIVPALTNVFNAALAGGGAKNINFNDLAADLAEITFEYPFRIPPYFALVIRAIGVLEGLALVGNPEFAIVDEAYPYISQRLLTDESPRLRAALRYMVYGREGVFDAERLIDMLSAFENFDVVRQSAGGVSYGAVETTDEAARASIALAFFFSPEGKFFREFLLDETVRGIDVLSRNAVLRLPELVPGPAGAALRSARVFVQAPLDAFVPELTPQEEKTLRSTTALLDFFLNRNTVPSTTAQALQTHAGVDGLASTGGLQHSVNRAAYTAQTLSPVIARHSDAMRDFGTQVVSRLAELFTVRAVRYTFGVDAQAAHDGGLQSKSSQSQEQSLTEPLVSVR